MFEDTITLFNRYHSKTLGDTWYPHVLHNVELNKDKASIWAKYGAESKDSATLIIHYGNVTVVSYIETLDTEFDVLKQYYELVNDTYVITSDTVFDNTKTYYEKVEKEQIGIEGLPFYPPKEWARQVNNKLPSSITFNDDASLFDFFIVGEWDGTSPILDESYSKGFYNEMNNQYDYCYAVTSVGGAYKLIPHFEIMAK